MEDIIKSIKAELYDRAVSPLSGALIVSWCIWNYKVIFVLFSSEIMQYKLNYLDVFYSKPILISFFNISLTLSNSIASGIVGPVITAFSYLIIYPVFAVPVYMFSLWVKTFYERAKNFHRRNKLLTFEQSMELHKKISEIEKQKEEEHKNYLQRIEEMTIFCDKKDSVIKELEKNNEELNHSFSVLESAHNVLLIKLEESGAEYVRDNISEPLPPKANASVQSIDADDVLNQEENPSEGKETKNIYEIFNVSELYATIPLDSKYNYLLKRIYEAPFKPFNVPYMFGSIWETLSESEREDFLKDFNFHVSNKNILGVKLHAMGDGFNSYIKMNVGEIEKINDLFCVLLSCFRNFSLAYTVEDIVSFTRMPHYYIHQLVTAARSKFYIGSIEADYEAYALSESGQLFYDLRIRPLLEKYDVVPLPDL